MSLVGDHNSTEPAGPGVAARPNEPDSGSLSRPSIGLRIACGVFGFGLGWVCGIWTFAVIDNASEGETGGLGALLVGLVGASLGAVAGFKACGYSSEN